MKDFRTFWTAHVKGRDTSPIITEISHLPRLIRYILLAAMIAHAAPQTTGCPSDHAGCQVAAPSSTKPTISPVAILRDKASITILVFSDFECFPCARSGSVLAGLVGQDKDVRLIFKHAPAATNTNSLLAHEAALAADAQGKFWEMHDLLFANQDKLKREDLLVYAKQLGLDLTAFRKALDKRSYRPVVERDLAEARGLGVTSPGLRTRRGSPARRIEAAEVSVRE